LLQVPIIPVWIGVGVVTPSPVDFELVVLVVEDGGIPKFSSMQYESPGIRIHDAPTEGFCSGQRNRLFSYEFEPT
jgi:hypothetical protein